MLIIVKTYKALIKKNDILKKFVHNGDGNFPALVFSIIRSKKSTLLKRKTSLAIRNFKDMNFVRKINGILSFALFTLIFYVFQVSAQKLVTPPRSQTVEDNTWWYLTIIALFIGLGGAILWYLRDKRIKSEQASLEKDNKNKKSQSMEDVDFDSELEWYRKNKNIVDKNSKKNLRIKQKLEKSPAKAKIINIKNDELERQGFSDEDYNKKLEKLQFVQLPIARFEKLEPSKPFDQLPVSNDEALISAIEQTQDEYEEDEDVRELAVRILARFKTKNAVEALSQVALYDLSSHLRSKAISILADFDHESVFETMLLSCADPTREVKAAAARGIFRLSFDRADCWMRIAESNDEYRMRHAARAAIAGDLVQRSFDRIIHSDRKIAQEVAALVFLLVRSGETEEVFSALENHSNPNVRKALLHVIRISKEHKALDGLYHLLEKKDLNEELREEIDRLVEEIGLVAA